MSDTERNADSKAHDSEPPVCDMSVKYAMDHIVRVAHSIGLTEQALVADAISRAEMADRFYCTGSPYKEQ